MKTTLRLIAATVLLSLAACQHDTPPTTPKTVSDTHTHHYKGYGK